LVELGKRLASQGFSLVATRSNKDALVEAGLECETVNKVEQFDCEYTSFAGSCACDLCCTGVSRTVLNMNHTISFSYTDRQNKVNDSGSMTAYLVFSLPLISPR
jgi:hypothetical protein